MNSTAARITARIRDFLETVFRIDRWSIDVPDYESDSLVPPSSAIAKPPRAVNINTRRLGPQYASVLRGMPFPAKTEFGYQILYRYPRNATYEQLPLNEALALLQSALLRAQTEMEEGVDRFIDIVGSGDITVAEDEKNDWILCFNLSFVVTYEISGDNELNPSPLMGATLQNP